MKKSIKKNPEYLKKFKNTKKSLKKKNSKREKKKRRKKNMVFFKLFVATRGYPWLPVANVAPWLNRQGT